MKKINWINSWKKGNKKNKTVGIIHIHNILKSNII